MGASQSLPSFIFPEMSESDLKTFVSSIDSGKLDLDLKYERTLGKGRVSWSMLVRPGSDSKALYLMRLYAKKSNLNHLSGLGRRRSGTSLSNSVDPLSATKLSFIHELYYEKCSQFDFVLKPLFIKDSEDFLVMVRPFARYNLPDRLTTESLNLQDKLWIAQQLIEHFIKLHSLRAFHGDFGTGKVFLTSQNKVVIGDFAPIKPFCLQSRQQSPIEFYQIWFDEGLDGEIGEIGRGCYLAPERLKFNSVETFEAADLFSLGCVLAELFGLRGFLQFKNVLKLSTSTTEEEYEILLSNFIEKCEIQVDSIKEIVRKLCSYDPKKRFINYSDLEVIQSEIDPEINRWRCSIFDLKASESFYEKKMRISALPEIVKDVEGLILMILKEKDVIIAALLVNYYLTHSKEVNSEHLKVILETWKDGQFVQNLIQEYLIKSADIKGDFDVKFPLIEALNKGNYGQLSEESDLKKVIQVIDAGLSEREGKEKLMGLYNKLLQIYRSREVYDADFESLLAFEYLKMDANEEDLELLRKSCQSLSEEILPAAQTRIAFQLDMEKNKIPIEKAKNEVEKVKKIKEKKVEIFGKMKQRLLKEKWKFNSNNNIDKSYNDILNHVINGLLQSPDKSHFLCYTKNLIYFWDLKNILRNPKSTLEPLASVNPRADSVITSVIYGVDQDTLIVSFNDGIIGLYKVSFKNSGFEFNICESFGPFESETLKLTMVSTCRGGQILLVIGKCKIYGIDSEKGEILFEFEFETFEIKQFVNILEGCLFILDSRGQFRMIELFYETGQILATWHLNSDVNFTIEASSIKSQSSKFVLTVKLYEQSIGRVVLVYLIDPLSEIVSCSFRHWTLSGKPEIVDKLEKSLPFINCIKGNCAEKSLATAISPRKNLICLDEEFVEVSNGILRLIDFTLISSLNSSSMLYPTNYKPSLKLRNKRASVPEIIEKTDRTSKSDDYIEGIIEQFTTFDGKNVIIIAVIDQNILLYC